jgi:hypothetical protein
MMPRADQNNTRVVIDLGDPVAPVHDGHGHRQGICVALNRRPITTIYQWFDAGNYAQHAP